MTENKTFGPHSTPRAKDAFSNSNIPSKVKIRFSTPADVERIIAYYESNPHPGYAPREATPGQIRDGRAILIEDDGGTIWGASVEYGFFSENQDENASNPAWAEIGTTRITLNGCGLYPVIIAAEALYAYLDNTPEQCVYADVHQGNEQVIKLLHGKLQWPEYDAPDELTQISQGSLDESKKGIPVNYYKCGEEQLPHQAATVMSMIKSGGLQHKSGQFIEVDLSDFPLATTYIQDMERLAAQSPGNDSSPAASGKRSDAVPTPSRRR